MKQPTILIICIFILVASCKKDTGNEIQLNSTTASTKKLASYLDTIAYSKWVFTEYYDKVHFQNQSGNSQSNYYMRIISDGNETANIDNTGKLFLNRNLDFNFAAVNYFNTPLQSVAFVNSSFTKPYNDTADYILSDKLIILTKPVKYLPDTMSILVADTACLVVSGKMYNKGYTSTRAIIFYKNTRWYGGYREYSGLLR